MRLYFKLHTLTYDLRYVTNEWEGWKALYGHRRHVSEIGQRG